MSLKYVGVVAAALSNERLKRAALLCDEVVCNNAVGDTKRAVDLGIVRQGLPSELHYAFSTTPEANASDAQRVFEYRKADVDSVMTVIHGEIDTMSKVIDGARGSRLNESSRDLLHRSVSSLGVAVAQFGDVWTRLHAELMRFSESDNLYLPIL